MQSIGTPTEGALPEGSGPVSALPTHPCNASTRRYAYCMCHNAKQYATPYKVCRQSTAAFACYVTVHFGMLTLPGHGVGCHFNTAVQLTESQ